MCPRTIIEATDRRFATVKILSSVIESLTERIEEVKTENCLLYTSDAADD